MKRILLSLGVVMTSVALNAQQNFVNGDFEAAMSPISGFAYTHSTDGWLALINGGPEASASEGAQAAKLVKQELVKVVL